MSKKPRRGRRIRRLIKLFRARKRQGIHPRTWVKLGGVVFLFFAILIGRSVLHSHVASHNQGRTLNGIFVGGVDISDKTKEQALLAIDGRLGELHGERVSFNLATGAQTSADFGAVGLGFANIDEVIEEAFYYGREGSLFHMMRRVRASRRGTLTKEFSLEYEVSASYVEEMLSGSGMRRTLNEPVNARIVLGEEEGEIVPDQSGEAFDISTLVSNINSYLNYYWQKGSASFEVPIKTVAADVTASQLSGLTDLLGTFTTYYGDGDASRVQNIENGASMINNILMFPGDEISASSLMAPYTLENGYAVGRAIAGNVFVESIGGGVCQVSTTLYNAMLYAEIEIVERHAHSLSVAYVPFSRDSAVAEGFLDLRVRNNMDTPIYVQVEIEPGLSITYNIFGKETRPENRRIKFISEATIGERPIGTTFVAVDQGIGVFYVSSEARAPVEFQLIKVVFIDDIEVERYVVNFSNYVSANRIMNVGTVHHNPDYTAAILAAISTQNEDTIRAAINRVLFGEPPPPAPPEEPEQAPEPTPEPTPEPEAGANGNGNGNGYNGD